jgi:hypothetical protein
MAGLLHEPFPGWETRFRIGERETKFELSCEDCEESEAHLITNDVPFLLIIIVLQQFRLIGRQIHR